MSPTDALNNLKRLVCMTTTQDWETHTRLHDSIVVLDSLLSSLPAKDASSETAKSEQS